MGRTVAKCCECGDEREIVSGQLEGHPRCSKCDMAERRREGDSLHAAFAVRGHHRWVKEQREERKRLHRILTDVDESITLSEEQKASVYAMVHPQLQELLKSLKPRHKRVNELTGESELTVNTRPS